MFKIKDMTGIKDTWFEKSVLNKKKYVGNKTHGWKKVIEIKRNMLGIKHTEGKSVLNKRKHVGNKRHGWKKMTEIKRNALGIKDTVGKK